MSFTVTVNEPDALLPPRSVAVQVTVLVPTGKPLLEAGEQAGVTPPSTRSLAGGSG